MNTCLFVACISLLPSSNASEVESVYRGATGNLILPHLLIGNKIYYVELNLIDPANLIFQVSKSSLVNITPAEDYIDPGPEAIVGTWIVSNELDQIVTLEADGTYTFYQPVQDESCPPGTESGTYRWDSQTGVFTTIILQDENDECGFGNGSGPSAELFQFFVDGDRLNYISTDHGSIVTGYLTRD